MEISTIKEKIRKLLALSTSPNEHEAKAALLKAQQLMAQYKLSQCEFVEAEKQKVKYIDSGIKFGPRHDPWILELANTISSNYCCRWFRILSQGCQNGTVNFIGFTDDVDLCNNAFAYAVDCVHSEQKKLRKKYKDLYYTGSDSRMILQGYGKGFVDGLKQAYAEQLDKNQEWGLVLVVPKEVNDEINGPKFGTHRVKNSGYTTHEYGNGFSAGKSFTSNKRLSC